MYIPVEQSQVLQTSQVLVPSSSYVLVPEAQIIPQYSYVAEVPQVLPVVSLPTEVNQIVTPVPQVSVKNSLWYPIKPREGAWKINLVFP